MISNFKITFFLSTPVSSDFCEALFRMIFFPIFLLKKQQQQQQHDFEVG